MSLSCTVSYILSVISQNLKRSRDSKHIPFGSSKSCMHSFSSVLLISLHEICSAYSFTNYKYMIEEICLKTGHMTLTTPLLGMICHHRLEFDTVYLPAKYDDSSFTAVPEISLRASKFKVGLLTMTTPLLRVICHAYAGT